MDGLHNTGPRRVGTPPRQPTSTREVAHLATRLADCIDGPRLRRSRIFSECLAVDLENVPFRLPVEMRLRLVADHRALEGRPVGGKLGPVGVVELELLA